MVVDFHDRNYFGDNMVIVGTGNLEHEQLVSLCDKYFSSAFPKKAP
jgi:predicted Zn-dependent peptidase